MGSEQRPNNLSASWWVAIVHRNLTILNWLRVDVNGVTAAESQQVGNGIEIVFQDFKGRAYSAKHVFQEQYAGIAQYYPASKKPGAWGRSASSPARKVKSNKRSKRTPKRRVINEMGFEWYYP